MKEIPGCKINFDGHAYGYGGVPREERGVYAQFYDGWDYTKETFVDSCVRNVLNIFFGDERSFLVHEALGVFPQEGRCTQMRTSKGSTDNKTQWHYHLFIYSFSPQIFIILVLLYFNRSLTLPALFMNWLIVQLKNWVSFRIGTYLSMYLSIYPSIHLGDEIQGWQKRQEKQKQDVKHMTIKGDETIKIKQGEQKQPIKLMGSWNQRFSFFFFFF